MSQDLSKAEKKLARELIDKGVNAEFKATLEMAAQIVQHWQEGRLDNRTAYQDLYSKIQKQNKFIAQRYDSITGSHYLTAVGVIYADGQITEEDIKGFSEVNRQLLNNWKKVRNS